MKYFIIAGEASGDMHASRLAAEIFRQDTHAQIQGWGGDLMQAQKVQLLKHCRDLAFMGYWEVLMNIRTILKNFKICKTQILNFKPDVIILIDYPGFNLRIAEWAKKQGIKTIYYISPQVWAWKEYRVKSMKKYIDKMFVILPFEKDYYAQKHHWEVTYLGHPLIENIEEYLQSKTVPRNSQYIVLMPGSRIQEIKNIFPPMLEATKQFPNEKFVVACSANLPDEIYAPYLKDYPHIKLYHGKSYDILYDAKIALVKSGTSTLETALMRVPQVVCYKAGRISFFIAKSLINLRFIALPNLIMDKEIIKELLQKNCTGTNIATQIQSLLLPETQEHMQEDYKQLYNKMRLQKGVSEQIAQQILSSIHCPIQS